MLNYYYMFGAIDIGGTKTLISSFTEDGKLIDSIKIKTPTSYQDFKIKVSETFKKLGNPSFKIVCVACPAKLDRIKGIALAFGNLTWVNIPIRNDFEAIFRCPIIIENDAKLAGLYEADVLGEKYRKVLYITVSTGIGGGLIINNRLEKDFEDIEPGQILLEHEGKLQRWEHFASGKAISLKYHQQASEITDNTIWYEIAKNIALGLIDLIALYTPNVVIIGGGVGAHFEKFSEKLSDELEIYQNSMIEIPPIIKAKDAEEAVIYGCYINAKIHYGKTNY
jgi:glucokinase